MLKYFLVIIFTCVHYTLMAQVNFLNPSFEDSTSGMGYIPIEWSNCNSNSPDLHPTINLTTLFSTDGQNHLGLGALTNFIESVGQQLIDTLKKDSGYCFSIDLARMPAHLSGSDKGQISIWLGDSLCNYDQLIYTSIPLDTLWNTYTVHFTANDDYRFFSIRSEFMSANGSYVYIDNLSDYGCDTTAVRVVEEQEPMREIKVFPNPASSKVTLQWDMPAAQSIQIYNNLGQLIQTIKLNEQQLLELDVQDLAAGLYHVTLHTTTDKYFTNFVIKR